ncbi:hypothetical protein PR202_gb27436 [Eleusine coracana subsp. coracana]|uniref:Uncharacterized protein n=1 Tax=Eleusine coracana subsp. coracana TaxID=191504 RepID=A0AAV5FV05_ELECO|nr:hypothetical protein PR202_gb27436 [Eleusine coracana subsp. coracana]
MPNWAKSSILFSRNVDDNTKAQITNTFPVQPMDPTTIHLGHPLIISHTERTRAYGFILNKFRAKLTTVKTNKINHVGRLAYINCVFASIPIFYMSNILFTKKFLAKLNAIVRNFRQCNIFHSCKSFMKINQTSFVGNWHQQANAPPKKLTGTMPIRLSLLPGGQEGIQAQITHLLSPSATQDLVKLVITTMWQLWKARNDKRFNKHNWSPQ